LLSAFGGSTDRREIG